MDELLMLHSEYLESLDMPPITAMLEQAAVPITLDEINAACHRLANYAHPGPNGKLIELYVTSMPARFLLCQLANQMLEKQELNMKEFVANSITHSSTSGDPVSGQQLSHYNIVAIGQRDEDEHSDTSSLISFTSADLYEFSSEDL
ncbi:hypothetical protein H4S07_001840 [Coemansia furcata]|uniref:Uncharacterized protein n=1 Tax=Coemansia furcata TaxID=417177 RepID=A0ACC1LN85_9FUNG|nr:hypothetical protein H4S07_001840 [Coemansia furcata]